MFNTIMDILGLFNSGPYETGVAKESGDAARPLF